MEADHGLHGRGLLHEGETFAIQGAVFEVNRHMGSGFLEAVYQECLAIEFKTREIPFVATPSLALTYKDVSLRQRYHPDFVCFDSVIVELKAVRELAPEHRAQVLNYLRGYRSKSGFAREFRKCAEGADRTFGHLTPVRILVREVREVRG